MQWKKQFGISSETSLVVEECLQTRQGPQSGCLAPGSIWWPGGRMVTSFTGGLGFKHGPRHYCDVVTNATRCFLA